MADKLEKNFWKAGQTPLSATNLNLMSNAIIDNAKAIENLVKTVEVTGEGEVITGASVGADGTLTLTKGNLPTASKEQKGVVKLNKNFEINENGELDIPIVTINVMEAMDGALTLTDEQINILLNNDNVIMKGVISSENTNMTFYLTKVSHIQEGEDTNVLLFDGTMSWGVIENVVPYYIAVGIDVINKALKISTFTFAQDLAKDSTGPNGTLLRLTGVDGDIIGNGIYISTINGEEIVSNTSGNITTSRKLTNITVSNWVSDTTYANYPYKATITAYGVTPSMVAEVIYSVADAESGNYAPVCETFTNGIYIYSKVNTTITIPTILVVK